MSDILRFLEGRSPDSAGRMVRDVLGFGPGDLENHHDFIQWLFPLPEPSSAVPGSPVLAHIDIVSIKAAPLAQRTLERAGELMSAFYDGTEHWMVAHNHNHLRITRIIKSLRLLVGNSVANDFRGGIFDHFERSKASVSQSSRQYWMNA